LKPYAEVLCEFAESLRFEDIPAKVVEKAKEHLIDTLGISLASTRNKYSQLLVEAVKELGGEAESTILGFGEKVPCANAALANGSLVHAVDYDDTHLESIAHLSAPVVPTALAVGETQESSGKEVLTAIIAGYEIMARIGNAAAGLFHKKGFHPTSICGTFAASIIAGKLLGLDSTQMANAMGICGSFASGILEFLVDGSWVKPIHAGWAAHAGIIAAQLAKKGLTGPHTVLEGRLGLYNTHVGIENVKKDKLIEGLGKSWETLKISIKPYPSCHFTHSFMDAALNIKKKYGINPNDISYILCLVPQVIVNIVCEPITIKQNPQTDYDAKFSLPFTVAMILLRDKAGLDEFNDMTIKDPETLSSSQGKVRNRPEL
jgi:2-methylcitrate dehydratase PrpD